MARSPRKLRRSHAGKLSFRSAHAFLAVTFYLCLGIGDSVFSNDKNDATETAAVSALPVGRSILCPESEYPVPMVRGLKFLDDGKSLWLFCASDDKIVRKFKVMFDRSQPSELQLAKKIRWPIYRGVVGRFSDLDVCVTKNHEGLLAIGGIGFFRPQVNLCRVSNSTSTSVLLSRQSRGNVSALAFHPSASYLAVGYGEDPQRGAEITLWKIDGEGKQMATISGELGSVDRLAFNPKGDRLATVDSGRGRVKLFRVAAAPGVQTLPVDESATTEFGTKVFGIAWLDDATWVVATGRRGVLTRNEPLNSKIQVKNSMPIAVSYILARNREQIGGGTLEPNTTVELPDNCDAIHIRDPRLEEFSDSLGLTLLRGVASRFEIRRIGGKPKLVSVSYATAVAAFADDERGLLATAFYDTTRGRLGASLAEVSLRSRRGNTRIRLEKTAFEDTVTALAFSQDGQYLAAAGLSRREQSPDALIVELRIWSTKTGNLLVRYPSANRILDAGAPIASVAIVGKGEETSVAFAHGPLKSNIATTLAALAPVPRPARIIHLIEPTKLAAIRNDGPVFDDEATTKRFAQQWLIQQETENRFFLSPADGNGEAIGPFPILKQYGTPYCAVRFRKAHRELLAVGYGYGILVWDVQAVRQEKALNPETQYEAIARAFLGHWARVACLAVSDINDAEWLLSGSDDGTICAWSLNGLDVDAKDRNELMVSFETVDDSLYVAPGSVVSNGPGWYAGFAGGQRILEVTARKEGLPQEQWIVPSDQMQHALEHPVPGQQLLIRAATGTQGSLAFFLVSETEHEPLWTMYPLLDNNWVIWAPTGHYLTSSPEAVSHFGRHVNLTGDPATPIRFFAADRFEERYQQSRRVNRLLINRRSLLEKPRPLVVRIEKLDARSSPEHDWNVPLATPEDLRVQIRAIPMATEEIQTIQIWCNGALVSTVSKPPFARTDRQLPKKHLRHGQWNIITAVAKGTRKSITSGGEENVVGRDSRVVYVGPGGKTPKLHYVGIGVTQLDVFQNRNVTPLKYAANDAFALGHALQKQADGTRFSMGTFALLVNRDSLTYPVPGKDVRLKPPTQKAILATLKSLSESVSADDLLCVFLSGHGFSERDGKSGFFFVAQDTKTNLENAVTGAEINAVLHQLPCATLLLIDACRSGSITSNRLLRDNPELALGPEIIASCKAGQNSYESPPEKPLRKQDGRWHGHGVFAAALIEVLTGRQLTRGSSGRPDEMVPLPIQSIDIDADGLIDIDEISSYVKARVPKLLTLLDQTIAYQQTPDILPSLTFPWQAFRLRSLAASNATSRDR